MSKTTDYLLEVMDRHQFDDMDELQNYFSVVQNGTITITTIVKEKKDAGKKMDVLPS
jgi:hypothetical protein